VYGTGSAWAGDGGSSGIGLQPVADDVWEYFTGLINSSTPAPQLPTITQLVLGMAGWTNQTPDAVRNINFVCFDYSPSELCGQLAVNAANGPLKSSPDQSSSAFPFLTSLPFTPGAVPTLIGDPKATNFFAATVLTGENGQPTTLDLFVETSKSGPLTLSFPLVVLNKNGTETPVAATLTANCNGFGPCSPIVSGLGPGNQTYSTDELGMYFGFAPRLVELRIPLVVTMQNDPPYFTMVEAANGVTVTTSPCPIGVNPDSGYCVAFTEQDLGSPAPRSLGKGAYVGIAPYPAPLCTTGANTNCPETLPTPPPTTYFGFCASFSNIPAIAAFVSVGTDGTTYASTPLPISGVTPPRCPPQS